MAPAVVPRALEWHLMARGLDAFALAREAAISYTTVRRALDARAGTVNVQLGTAERLLTTLDRIPIRITDLDLIGPNPGPAVVLTHFDKPTHREIGSANAHDNRQAVRADSILDSRSGSDLEPPLMLGLAEPLEANRHYQGVRTLPAPAPGRPVGRQELHLLRTRYLTIAERYDRQEPGCLPGMGKWTWRMVAILDVALADRFSVDLAELDRLRSVLQHTGAYRALAGMEDPYTEIRPVVDDVLERLGAEVRA